MMTVSYKAIPVVIMVDWDWATSEVMPGLQEVNFKEVTRLEKRGLLFGKIPKAQLKQLSSIGGVRWYQQT